MQTKYYEMKITRAMVSEKTPSYKADCPQKIAAFFQEVLSGVNSCQEHLWVAFLDTAQNIIGFNLVTIGEQNQTIAHPADIFRAVLLSGTKYFALIHNHPSNLMEPSQADRSITRRIKEGAEIFQMSFLDHVIVSETGYYSFRENGLI